MWRSKQRVGLVGCGIWGANILRDLLALGAEVVVVDVDERARARALTSGACAVAATPDAVSVEGWVVATPASTHADAIGAIAGDALPILCEKPLAVSTRQAVDIREMVRGPFHVLDVWRYHPAVEAMQRLVDDRSLGRAQGLRLTRANWTSPRVDVDTVWNLGPHEVSIFMQVFGQFPEPHSALAECLDGQARSLFSLWGEAPWLVSEISNRYETRRREIRLHGETGVAVFDGRHPARIEWASGDADEHLEARDRRWVEIGTETALRRQLSVWLRFLDGAAAPRSDLEYGVRVVQTMERLRTLAGLAT